MTERFSEADVGKTVENADGETVGIVAAVEGGTAHVDPDPGLLDSILATIGWKTDPEETVPIEASDVDEVTADGIRLDTRFWDRDEPIDASAATAVGSTDGREEPTDRPNEDDGPSPGMVGEADREVASRDDPDASEGMGEPESTERADERNGAEPIDAAEEIGGAEEVEGADELSTAEEMRATEEMDEVDRGIEADPSEVVDEDSEAQHRPEEDVGERSDAVDPDEDVGRTDAAVEPEDVHDPDAGVADTDTDVVDPDTEIADSDSDERRLTDREDAKRHVDEGARVDRDDEEDGR